MKRTDARILAAKDLEARLKAEGRHPEAQVVENLRRSLSVATNSLAQLWRENAALRGQGGEENKT